ncbi:9475_t:CDS:2, partial [Acaulospora morrowiae]
LYKDREDSFSKNMVQCLESRWKQWEQPLLILSFFLHPKYRNSVFNSNLPSLNVPQIGLWVKYYYKEWFKTRPSVILSEFSKFINKDYPFDDDTFSNFNDVQEYWKFTIGATKELSILAVRIFSICINSASCERLFSSMGFIHSVQRNRLQVARELEQRIYANTITYNAENHESNPECFSESIEIPSEEIDIIINESEEMTTVNDSNEYGSVTNTDVNNEWRAVLNDWSEDLMAENTETLAFESQTPDDLLTRHPADDPAGKWNLADLFIVEFPAPSAMKNLQSVYDVDN